MSKPSETLVVVNSANRDIATYPEPNDFVLDLKQRYEVQLISLGFLQLPYSQFLIEHDWDSFLFDVGLSFPLQAARTLYFRAPEGGSKELVCLPAPYTQVVYVGQTAAGLSLWRVDPRVGPLCVHGLAQASLGIVPARLIYDPSQEPLQVCQVPSASELLTAGAPSATLSAGYTAVLACTAAGVRTFCGPEHLCGALNAFLGDAAIQVPLRFNYVRETMTLTMQPQALAGSVLFLHAPDTSLLSTLYFPCARGCTIPLQPLVSTRFPGAIERRVPIGNYDYNSLRQQLEILVNPLGQFSTLLSSKIYVNFFGEKEMPPFTEVAIAGVVLYDPKAVALWVSEQLAQAGVAIRVDFREDTFVIFSQRPFRIFWGESRLGAQLGFDADLKLDVFHRGVPRFYCQTPSRVQLAQVYGGESCQHMKTLVFQSSGRLQGFKRDGPTVLAASPDGLAVPVGIVPSEYLVALPCPGGGGGFYWTVASLTQAGLMPEAPAALPRWTTLLSPLVSEDLSCLCTPGQTIVPFAAFNGAVNLYFPTPPGSMQPRMAEIMGFQPGANLWQVETALSAYGPSPALKAPYHVTLEGPFYVLVELGLEHMSATITHRNGNDVKSRYFAVIALFSNFKLERYYKAEQATTGINVVNSFNVRITNPWGAIYQFHGKNWSAALNFVHVQKAIRTECP